MKGVDLFLHALFNFQESVASPAAQQGADGDKAGDQRRLDPDTTATAQNLEKGNAAHSKETGVLLGVTYSRDSCHFWNSNIGAYTELLGWGGWDDDVSCTCTHVRCYATDGAGSSFYISRE